MSEKVITNHMINCLPRIHISKIYTSDCIKHTDTQTHTNTQCKFPIQPNNGSFKSPKLSNKKKTPTQGIRKRL